MKISKTAASSLCSLLILLAMPTLARAGKIPMRWTPPTTNSNGSKLTDLVSIRVEWGTCNGADFGTYRNGANFPPASVGGTVVTGGVNPVCVHVFAINSKNIASAPSPTIVVRFSPSGQPVVLN